ncbi:MAG: divergent polysaccharide deacetylase family protein [Maritimibacter harenae]
MARGVISGLVTGVIVAGAGLVTASLTLERVEIGGVAPVDAGAEVETVMPETGDAAPEEETDAVEAPADAAPTEEAVETEPAGSSDTAPVQEEAAPETEVAPETTETAPDDSAPADSAAEPTSETESEDEAEPSEAPDTTEPAQDATQTEPTEQPDASLVPETDTTDEPEPVVAAPETQAEEEEMAQLPTVVAPADPVEPDVRMPSTDGDTIRAGQGSFAPPPLPSEEDSLEEPTEELPVITGRLPSIGDETEEAEEDAAPAGPQPPIKANAVAYEPAGDLPEMAVLLIDTGPGREDVGDLAVMPFPLSVAVDASAPDAEAAIDFYRSVGAEVVLIVPLPEAPTAMDVEVTFQAYEPLLERVVGVMFPQDEAFQGLGDAAEQVVTILDERGLGLVTYPEGLNTGHKIAVRDGVPAAQVFRDLDGEGQEADVIRRFLDNVAFRARNVDGVIAVARVKPGSIQALLEWTLGNRAQSVNFAPVSAVLLDE